MPGIFNAIGHETEPQAASASARLLAGVRNLSEVLIGVENRNLASIQNAKDDAVPVLRQAAAEFDRIVPEANDYLLLPNPDLAPSLRLERDEIVDSLEEWGYTNLRNPDLFTVAAHESRELANLLDRLQFTGQHRDWYAVRDLVHATTRVLEVGVQVSRMASLHGDDPALEL